MKTRSFSIFLLKEGYNAQNSLKPDHQLLNDFQAQNLPEGASLFISDRLRTTPWWVNYFSIRGDLEQENKGALIFLPVRGRCFALTFGHMYHNLLDVSYEYDFGLKVTLNSLEPKELKSADIVDPGASRRKRMQVPIMSDLTYLDFDSNSEILKSLTGKVKPQYEELFKNATGSTSLKVGLKLEPEELIDLCEQLLDLYSSNEYLESFPNIQKIVPEKDPLQIKRLDASLLEAFINKSSELSLSIPDIVDYSDNIYCIFKGRKGISPIYTNI
ncbi:TIGR04141 family sporadically distributed protein, partial [Cronobacter sakazakii]